MYSIAAVLNLWYSSGTRSMNDFFKQFFEVEENVVKLSDHRWPQPTCCHPEQDDPLPLPAP